jgi:hypothetical protein
MIPNIFHLIYDEVDTKDLTIYQYICIRSIIEINNPEFINFYYKNTLPEGKLWDSIKKKLSIKKDIFNIKIKTSLEAIIYKILIDYGGIYLNMNSICIKPLKDLLNHHKFIKSSDDQLICSEIKSNLGMKYFKFYTNDITFEENYDNEDNLLLKDYGIKNIFKEITDYNFSEYFTLIKNSNSYFLSLNATVKEENLDFNNTDFKSLLTKTTTYGLLVKNMLSYNYISEQILTNNVKYKKNLKLINNIDTIYWINLEESIERRNKMVELLKKFDIKNERINAINGKNEINIHKKYFVCEKGNYPKYCNKEYAILSSHLNTIDLYCKIPSSELLYGYALICEDDLSLDFINYWEKDIKKVIDEAPDDWDIIMLGYFSLKINYENLYNKWNNEWSAIAYLVNHKNVSSKIDNLKSNNKWICTEDDLMVSDNYIFSKLNTYVYKYPYFTFPNENDSTFHIDHLDYHRIYKSCNYLTLNNVFDSLESIENNA